MRLISKLTRSKFLTRKEIHCHKKTHVSSPSQIKWVSGWAPLVACDGAPASGRADQEGGLHSPLPSLWVLGVQGARQLQAGGQEDLSSWAKVRHRGLGSADSQMLGPAATASFWALCRRQMLAARLAGSPPQLQGHPGPGVCSSLSSC